jgi:hypothetical protein
LSLVCTGSTISALKCQKKFLLIVPYIEKEDIIVDDNNSEETEPETPEPMDDLDFDLDEVPPPVPPHRTPILRSVHEERLQPPRPKSAISNSGSVPNVRKSQYRCYDPVELGPSGTVTGSIWRGSKERLIDTNNTRLHRSVGSGLEIKSPSSSDSSR